MEKNQGPTLLRFEKMPSLSRKRDGENPRKNDGEKPQENPMQHHVGCTQDYGGGMGSIVK